MDLQQKATVLMQQQALYSTTMVSDSLKESNRLQQAKKTIGFVLLCEKSDGKQRRAFNLCLVRFFFYLFVFI